MRNHSKPIEPALDALFRMEAMIQGEDDYHEDGCEMHIAVPFRWIREIAEEFRKK